MLIKFEEVKLQSTKTGKCLCGKKIKRSKTFTQTINPFNKKNGVIKNRTDILKELHNEINEWKNQPVHCECPSYWEMTKEQRYEYDNNGFVIIKLSCGCTFKKYEGID